MSGGHFNGQQYNISNIINEIEFQITNNEYEYSDQTLDEFKKAVNILNNELNNLDK
jgi:hypothetical protein